MERNQLTQVHFTFTPLCYAVFLTTVCVVGVEVGSEVKFKFLCFMPSFQRIAPTASEPRRKMNPTTKTRRRRRRHPHRCTTPSSRPGTGAGSQVRVSLVNVEQWYHAIRLLRLLLSKWGN